MNVIPERLQKIVVVAAHPDDETIACSGLLQRAVEGLIVFAVDGAPSHYGFEKKFGSLQQYSEERFREAGRALRWIPHFSFRRLAREDGSWFVDQHLFLNLPEAFASLQRIVREFSPDLLVSHAFEGGHIDHDACHVVARQVANALDILIMEFPLYWKHESGRDVFQTFRDRHDGERSLELSEKEITVKERMLSEYQTQRSLISVFQLKMERFRPMVVPGLTKVVWSGYPFENRRRQLETAVFLRKIADFHRSLEASVRFG